MKRNFVVWAVLLVVSLFCGLKSASADVSLGNNINLPGFSFNYSINPYGNNTQFSANLENSDSINSVSVSVSRYVDSNVKGGGNQGYVSIFFSGTVTPATVTDQSSESVSINRHGVSVNSNVGTNSYREQIGWDDKNQLPILGAWLNQGWGSVTLQDVDVLYSYANYNEYDGGSEGKGVVFSDAGSAPKPIRYWYATVNWQVAFNDPISAAYATSLGASVSASPSAIPEPASMGVLILGALSLLARRRRSA